MPRSTGRGRRGPTVVHLGPEEAVIYLKKPYGGVERAASRRLPSARGDFFFSRSPAIFNSRALRATRTPGGSACSAGLSTKINCRAWAPSKLALSLGAWVT